MITRSGLAAETFLRKRPAVSQRPTISRLGGTRGTEGTQFSKLFIIRRRWIVDQVPKPLSAGLPVRDPVNVEQPFAEVAFVQRLKPAVTAEFREQLVDLILPELAGFVGNQRPLGEEHGHRVALHPVGREDFVSLRRPAESALRSNAAQSIENPIENTGQLRKRSAGIARRKRQVMASGRSPVCDT